MLRIDGDFVFYRIQEYQSKWNRWVIIQSYYLKEYEFGEHSASGQCWQEIGEHGIYDLDYAKTYCNKLNDLVKANGGMIGDVAQITKFRILRVEISQTKTPLEFDKY